MSLTKEQAFGMYIGQKVIVKENFISTFNEVGRGHLHLGGRDNLSSSNIRTNIDDCKLILRTYEDMTEEEYKRFRGYGTIDFIKGTQDVGKDIVCLSLESLRLTKEQFEYLISIGIDVFGLIERGWAVRESEEKK